MALDTRIQQIPLFVFSQVCSSCGIEKPIEAFELEKRGRRTQCMHCRYLQRRERKRLLHPPASELVACPGYKSCLTCHQEKSLEDFTPLAGGKYGRKAQCKQCVNARDREQREAKNKPVFIPLPGHRFCTECEQEKPFSEFDIHSKKLLPGYAAYESQCKECKKPKQHARRQTPEYKEYDRIKHRKNKKYYAAHYLETKEAHQERGRKWRKANPEKQRERNLSRKAAKLNATVEPVDYKAILERDGWYCYICEKPIDPTAKSRTSTALVFDHVIPLQPRPGEPQGAHSEDNIKPAHNACNVRKGHVPFEQLTSWQRRGV